MTAAGTDLDAMRQAHQVRVDAFNHRDSAGVAALYAEEAVVHDPLELEPIVGRDAVAANYAGFFAAFPDAHVDTVQFLSGDGAIAYRIIITGTHTGPLPTDDGAIPPTGRAVQLHAAVVADVDPAGRLTRVHRYVDVASLLRQLGIG